MPNYSIIVDCPDCYLDILKVFFFFLEKNWPARNQKIYVVTQNQTIDSPDNVEFIKCGDNLNSIQRTKKAIEKISDEYVLIIDCDDFIGKRVDDSLIDNLLTFASSNEIDYIRVWNFSNHEQKKYKTKFNHLYFCNKKARYAKSLMANFWKKEEYLKVFNSNTEDGWTVEGNWLKETYLEKKGFYKNYCFYSKNPFHIVHAVKKGKWIRKAYRFARKNGTDKDLLSQRDRISFFDNLSFEIKMFLLRRTPSRFVFFIKRLTKRKVKYVSDY